MKNLHAAIACALRNGCVETEFSGRFALPEKYTLDAGDEIFVPTDFIPLAQPMCDERGDGRYFTFIYTSVRDKEGNELPFRLYPGLFNRTVRDTEGKFHRTGGNLIYHLCKFDDTKAAMDSLRGRTIKVTDCLEVGTIRPSDGFHQVKRVYSFDLV